jgi:hypothetical protein
MTAPLPVDLAVQADRLPGPVEAAACYLVAEAVVRCQRAIRRRLAPRQARTLHAVGVRRV